MTPIYTRSELIEVAIRCAPTSAVARRIREQGATIFGGVTSPEGFPGWIVRVYTTPDGAAHGPGAGCRYIGVWFDERQQKYRISHPTGLPDGAKILKGERL